MTDRTTLEWKTKHRCRSEAPQEWAVDVLEAEAKIAQARWEGIEPYASALKDLLNWIEPECNTAFETGDCDKGWHNDQSAAIKNARALLGDERRGRWV